MRWWIVNSEQRQYAELVTASAISGAAATACSDARLGLYFLWLALHPSEADEHLLECGLTD